MGDFTDLRELSEPLKARIEHYIGPPKLRVYDGKGDLPTYIYNADLRQFIDDLEHDPRRTDRLPRHRDSWQ